MTPDNDPVNPQHYRNYKVEDVLMTTQEVTQDNDPVNPQHYRNYKIEVIEILEEAIRRAPDPVSGSLQWQTLKYMLRLWDKDGPLQDAKKARWYLDRLIATLEGR